MIEAIIARTLEQSLLEIMQSIAFVSHCLLDWLELFNHQYCIVIGMRHFIEMCPTQIKAKNVRDIKINSLRSNISVKLIPLLTMLYFHD